jgi:hypothetical protein
MKIASAFCLSWSKSFDTSYIIGMFGMQNKPMKLNDYFIGITIILFGCTQFLGIAIFMRRTILVQRRLLIPLKKKKRGIVVHEGIAYYSRSILFFEIIFFLKKKRNYMKFVGGATTPRTPRAWSRPPMKFINFFLWVLKKKKYNVGF